MVENGQVVVRPMNYLALSYDHRIIDGREAVLSLVAIKEALEDPARHAAGSCGDGRLIRRRRDRRRPRRLHRRDPRRAARLHDRVHRRLDARRRQARAGRHLHERRLHSVEGAAAVVGELRARGPRVRRARHQRRRARRSTSRKMLARKDKVVAQNNDGILYLFKKNKITFFHGRGAFAGKDGDRWQHRRRRTAAPATIVAHARDHRHRLARRARCPASRSTTSACSTTTARWRSPAVPKRLGVVGAGVIGLEMGSVWRRLGVEGDDPRGAAGVPRRRRRGDRQGSAEGLHASRASRSSSA